MTLLPESGAMFGPILTPKQPNWNPLMEPQSTSDERKLLRRLVDLEGLEPSTSSMPWKRAPSCATGPIRETEYRYLSMVSLSVGLS